MKGSEYSNLMLHMKKTYEDFMEPIVKDLAEELKETQDELKATQDKMKEEMKKMSDIISELHQQVKELKNLELHPTSESQGVSKRPNPEDPSPQTSRIQGERISNTIY